MGKQEWQGLNEQEVELLRKKWKTIKQDSLWTKFEDFLFWAATNGFRPGLAVRKKHLKLPFSADNAQLIGPKRDGAMPNSLCSGCILECPAKGCAEWRRRYQRYWNQNIHRKKTSPVSAVFCYEHPDLIREGIVNG